MSNTEKSQQERHADQLAEFEAWKDMQSKFQDEMKEDEEDFVNNSEVSHLEGIKQSGRLRILEMAQVITEKLHDLYKTEDKKVKKDIGRLLSLVLELAKTAA